MRFRRLKKLTAGSLVVAWSAVLTATISVFEVPSNYCVELPTPSAVVVMTIALVVGGLAALTAFYSDPTNPYVITVVLLAFAAGGWVVAHFSDVTGSWGCG